MASVPGTDTAVMPLPASLLVGLYFVLLVCLSVYGLHRAYLLYLYTRYRPRRPAPPLDGDDGDDIPFVTVQLPVYNELYVVERLIDAAARLDHPPQRLEIQVLDDSTDETQRIAAAAVARWSARGVAIRRLHRTQRTGYKAGALAAGLLAARGEAIAIFDADFIPPRDFLRRALPALRAPGVGLVQARWGHVNRECSWLTRVQALLLDAHFVLEHGARNRGGCFFNFNGTAGVWRRAAIDDAGGWQPDTLTEDLDLSYRAQLAGWRFVFLPDLVAPAELPVEMNAFKTQQHRWAMGSIQTCLKVLPGVLRSGLPPRLKLEAFFHLTANFNYPLLLLASVLMVPALFVRALAGSQTLLLVDVPLFCAAALSMVNFYAVSQRAVRRDWLSQLRYVPLAIAVGVGLSVNNTRAVLGALRRARPRFERTPKYGVVGRRDEWRTKRYRQAVAGQPLVELALGIYFTLAVLGAASSGLLAAVPLLCVFQLGFLYMGLVSLLQQPRPARAGVSGARPAIAGDAS